MDHESWETLLDGYSASLDSKAMRTRTSYLSVLRQFIAWVEEYRALRSPVPADAFTRSTLEAWFETLPDQELSLSHRARARAALTRFCQWAIDERGLLNRNAAARIQLEPAERPRVARALDAEQRRRLLIEVERSDPRGKALFALAYHAGCRAVDITHLKLADLHLRGEEPPGILVGAADQRARYITVPEEVRVSLEQYLQGSQGWRRSPYVFRSTRGERLTESGLHHWFRQLKATAAPEAAQHLEGLTFHHLRADFAVRAHQEGWPADVLASHLGKRTLWGRVVPAAATFEKRRWREVASGSVLPEGQLRPRAGAEFGAIASGTASVGGRSDSGSRYPIPGSEPGGGPSQPDPRRSSPAVPGPGPGTANFLNPTDTQPMPSHGAGPRRDPQSVADPGTHPQHASVAGAQAPQASTPLGAPSFDPFNAQQFQIFATIFQALTAPSNGAFPAGSPFPANGLGPSSPQEALARAQREAAASQREIKYLRELTGSLLAQNQQLSQQSIQLLKGFIHDQNAQRQWNTMSVTSLMLARHSEKDATTIFHELVAANAASNDAIGETLPASASDEPGKP